MNPFLIKFIIDRHFIGSVPFPVTRVEIKQTNLGYTYRLYISKTK